MAEPVRLRLLAEFLEVPLGDQPLDISLADVELAVLAQRDSPIVFAPSVPGS